MCILTLVKYKPEFCGHSFMYRDSCELSNPYCCGQKNRSVKYFEVDDICDLCLERLEYQETAKNKEYMKRVFEQLKRVTAQLVEEENTVFGIEQEDVVMTLCEQGLGHSLFIKGLLTSSEDQIL